MKFFLEKLIQRESLEREEASAATEIMLSKSAVSEQSAAFLSLLRAKRESSEEILGVMDVILPKMIAVNTSLRTLDIVGTGGDGLATVNISSGAAILAASCGVLVAKHGNRAVSSQCGSADVFQMLGINIETSAIQAETCLSHLGIAFFFAPNFHPALTQMRDLRKRLGIPTVFNLVGPLLNPCRPQHYILGVFSAHLLQIFADLLSELNVKKSVVVCAEGMDEISCSGITRVIEVNQGRQRAYEIDPRQFDIPIHSSAALQGGDARCNARLLLETFSGKSGAIADALILNTGMAVYLYGIGKDLYDSVSIARQHLMNGSALRLLERWKGFEYA